MNFTKSQLIVFGSIGLVVLVFVLIFLGVLPGLKPKNQSQTIKAQVQIWGVFDSSAAYETAFQNIQKTYPQLTLTFRGFTDINDYEATLLDALAAGKGPDIFMIRNNSLPKEINKITPVPQTAFSLVSLRNLFPQVVEQDFVSRNAVYALPLSIDTLALIYNRDILDQATVAPPQTWEDLVKAVPNLLKTDSDKNVSRAAVALGTATNVDNAADILSTLMLQTGTQMVSPDFKAATFASQEGVNALSFYTGFADPKNSTYAWNGSLPNSLDAFSQGKVAMIFDYASALPEIKARNTFLNLAVASLPQPQNAQKSITYPDYWGFTVSRQSRQAALAWNVILGLTTDAQTVKAYLDVTGRPPALRAMAASYANDPTLNVFAKQILWARSWPEADAEAITKIFLDAITAALGKTDLQSDLRQAQDQVTALMVKQL